MAFDMIRRPLQRGIAALLSTLVLAAGAAAALAQAGETIVGADVAVVLAATLPPEAVHTLQLIRHGGPFPYPKDGIVFGNREHLLPLASHGFYHEYTVPPPGTQERGTARDRDLFRARVRDSGRDRGARRIVCGGSPADGVCYYTPDHYTSFQRIAG